MKYAVLGLIITMLLGCGMHGVMTVTDKVKSDVEVELPPYEGNVFVTQEAIQPGAYDVVGTIDARMNTNESDQSIMRLMANEARKIGCNAIVEVDIWRMPSGWSKNSPHSRGKCVKLRDQSATDSVNGYSL